MNFSFQELGQYNFNLSDEIGKLIVSKKKISFQDMKNTLKEFKFYFEFEIDKNSDVDTIIFSQVSRHLIVHVSSIADTKFIKQIRSAIKRILKTNIKGNDEIAFSVNEIEDVIKSMNSFLRMLFKKYQNK